MDEVNNKRKLVIALVAAIVALLAIIAFVVYYFNFRTGLTKKNGSIYYLEKGNVVKNQWIKIGDKSYYSEADGKIVTGLYEIENETYYFSDKGQMLTGFVNDKSGSRYFDPTSGKMMTGYTQISGDHYYFAEDGLLLKGRIKVGDKDYYFDDEGKQVMGLIRTDNNDLYFYDEDGTPYSGFKTIDNLTYYFDEEGKSVYGFVESEGRKYYIYKNHSLAKGACVINNIKYGFDDDGVLMTGFVTIGEKMYFADDKGVFYKNKYEEIEGKLYRFDTDGCIVTGWLVLSDGKRGYAKADGEICRNCIEIIDKSPYYFSSTGAVGEVGFIKFDKKTYYVVNIHGMLQTGRLDKNGESYYFDETGVLKTGWISEGEKFLYADKDGKILKGSQTIENLKCNFDKEGYLLSKEVLYYKYVALTYDDGPSAYTPKILDVMEKTGAKCTFFVVGNRVSGYANTVKRAYDLGCEIGNQTYDNKYLTQLQKADIISQVSKTDDVVRKITGKNCPVLRPPGGYINDTVAGIVAKPCIRWSVDTQDWKTRDTKETILAATTNIKDGDVILMHDLYESTADACESIVTTLMDNGFKCVTVSELAQLRGGLKAGKTYKSFYK